MTSPSRLAALFACSLLIACGDFDSGVDDSKKVEQITQEEAEQLCSSTGDYASEQITADQTKQFGCYFGGLRAAEFMVALQPNADFAMACMTSYDECMMQPDMTQMSQDDCSGAMPPANCDVTVAEYEDCVQERIQLTKEAISQVSCERMSLQVITGVEDGPNCQAIKDRCPSALAYQDSPI